MAKNKTKVDLVEIDEIINLFINSLGHKGEIKCKAVSDFNFRIVQEKLKRENGELFSLYKYNFWAGGYKGELNYGKKRIIEINEKNKVQVIGSEFEDDYTDLISLIYNLHKKPDELAKRILLIIKKRDKRELELNRLLKLSNAEVVKLKNMNDALLNGFTNIFFQSFSPNNSLNNMMALSKSKDAVCYEELKNMFGDVDRFSSALHISEEQVKTDIPDEVSRLRRLKRLEEEGF